jgi:outer membrane receptor for ferrienterochelin and colicins
VRTSLSQVLYASVSRQLEAYALWRFTPAVQLRVTLQNILAQDALALNRFTDASGTSERSNIDLGFMRYGFLLEIKL